MSMMHIELYTKKQGASRTVSAPKIQIFSSWADMWYSCNYIAACCRCSCLFFCSQPASQAGGQCCAALCVWSSGPSSSVLQWVVLLAWQDLSIPHSIRPIAPVLSIPLTSAASTAWRQGDSTERCASFTSSLRPHHTKKSHHILTHNQTSALFFSHCGDNYYLFHSKQ